jgi:hypothetical protein
MVALAVSMDTSGLSRRQFSFSFLAATSLACCPACAARALAANDEQILCAAAGQGAPQAEALLDSTGDANLDRILAAEMMEQSRYYGIQPAFMLYSGPNQNALATTKTRLENTKGTILYNVGFLQSQLKSGQWGGTVVAGVLAHEFGHIYQFFSAYAARLQGMHSTVKFQELHADFLSAFYMAKKFVASGVKLNDYFDAFYALGDYQFDQKDHHGTKEERYIAIKAGHNLSLGHKNEGIAFAASQGEAFLKEYIR